MASAIDRMVKMAMRESNPRRLSTVLYCLAAMRAGKYSVALVNIATLNGTAYRGIADMLRNTVSVE